MTYRFTWHGEKFGKALVPVMQKGVGKMAVELQSKMKRNLAGIEGGGPIHRRVSGRALAMTKSGAVRINKQTGKPILGQFRAGLSATGGKQYDPKLKRVIHVGRVYWTGPGAPAGHLPFVRSGSLKNRISMAKAGTLKMAVGSNLPYALPLELGTRHMRPRPWAKRSAAEAADNMRVVFQRHMLQEVPRLLPRYGLSGGMLGPEGNPR